MDHRQKCRSISRFRYAGPLLSVRLLSRGNSNNVPAPFHFYLAQCGGCAAWQQTTHLRRDTTRQQNRCCRFSSHHMRLERRHILQRRKCHSGGIVPLCRAGQRWGRRTGDGRYRDQHHGPSGGKRSCLTLSLPGYLPTRNGGVALQLRRRDWRFPSAAQMGMGWLSSPVSSTSARFLDHRLMQHRRVS